VRGSSTLPDVSGSRSCVAYPYPATFILFMHMGETVVYTTNEKVVGDGR